jgi:radical SAM superfamily enzyme YgiQ (UPF0313 family)
MTDLVIINPAASHGIYGPLGDDLIAVEPPQWCRLLAGYIQDKGYSVEILDAEAVRLDHAMINEWMTVLKPELVCVAVYGHQPSASTQQMWGARQLLEAATWGAPTILVGGHPSALPIRTLREEKVDYVAAGEGHLTLLGLLQHDDVAIIPGLVWHDGKTIRVNKPAPLCEDLRELHGHVWDKLPMGKYRAHNWQCLSDLDRRQPYASIYTSLGCSFACSFCCINAPFGSNRYRTRRPDDVVDEIEYLFEEHHVRTLKITDEMFVLNPKHYLTVCEGLIKRGLGKKLNIWAYARVDTVKGSETLAALGAAGIRWLALGIESASKHVRDGADKRLGTDDIIGTVRRIQAAGIHVIGNFMFGLRDDTLETMNATLDLAIKSLPDWANFYSTMAYPGSGLYQQALKENWTLPGSWRGYSQHNDDCRPLDTEHVMGEAVLAFRDQAFLDFFTSQQFRKHTLGKFGNDALHHVDRMTQYKLDRKLLNAQAAE